MGTGGVDKIIYYLYIIYYYYKSLCETAQKKNSKTCQNALIYLYSLIHST